MWRKILFAAVVIGLATQARSEPTGAEQSPPPPAFTAASCGAAGEVTTVVPDTAEARAAAEDYCRTLSAVAGQRPQPGVVGG